MIKKIIAVLIGLAAMLIVPVAANASSYGFKNGDYVELNGYRFKVIDSSIDFLYYDGYLENRAWDTNGTKDFNQNDTTNIAYYLNNTFLENLGSVKQHIKNTSWTAGRLPYSNTASLNYSQILSYEDDQFVTAKIGLISLAEMKKYHSIIGNPFVRIWSRIASSANNSNVYYIETDGVGRTDIVYTASAIVPVLRLDAGINFVAGSGTRNDPYTTAPDIVLSEVKDLALLNTTTSEIILSWKNPSESIFSHLNLYIDGTLKETNFKNETYKFSGLTHNKEYTFTIKAVDTNGNETKGISIIVSTADIPLVPEVKNLGAIAKLDRVNLSWKNPESEFFKTVRIYKRIDGTAVKDDTNLKQLLQPRTVFAAETNAEEFTPTFETNGTFWSDLTVKPETTYSYKITTLNVADAESEGVLIRTKTPGEPLPELGGGGYTEDENGDFLFTWTQPITGKVKVLIDGQDYRVVDASLKQILIPKEDMKYDIFNRPKVTLIPISEDGKEGTPTKPGSGSPIGNVNVPFGPTDLLKSSMGLLGVLAPFLLLVLAIYYVPKIKNIIVQAVQKRNERRY